MDWLSEIIGIGIPSIWAWLIAGLTALAIPIGTYFKGGKDKERKLDLKHREELDKRDEEVRNVIRETQRNLDRLGPDDVVDSLRRNDGSWSGV